MAWDPNTGAAHLDFGPLNGGHSLDVTAVAVLPSGNIVSGAMAGGGSERRRRVKMRLWLRTSVLFVSGVLRILRHTPHTLNSTPSTLHPTPISG